MNVRSASGIRRDHPRFIGPYPSSDRNISASVRDASGIRGLPRQRFDLRRCPGWNSSVSIRPASKLRRAHPRTITSRRSPEKLSNKHPRHVQAPKSLSATFQLEVELRVEPSDERPARLQPPKRPLAGHRLAFQPRGTIRWASIPPPSSEEPFSSASTHFPAPGGAFHRASGQPPASEETVNRSSTRIPAPGGERHRASQPPLGSEEPFSDSLTRFRSPGNSSRSSGSSRGSEEPVNDPSKQPELPKNTSTNARFASGFRRIRRQSVVSLPRTQRAILQASRTPQGSEEPV